MTAARQKTNTGVVADRFHTFRPDDARQNSRENDCVELKWNMAFTRKEVYATFGMAERGKHYE
jgi:hypothetical protein